MPSGPAMTESGIPRRVARFAAFEFDLETGELRAASDPVLTDPQLSFQLAQALQDLDFLNVLLRNRSEQQRLKQLTDYLARQVPKMKEVSRMRKLAPLNGHGNSPSGITD